MGCLICLPTSFLYRLSSGWTATAMSVQLAGDRSARLGLPLPDMLQERLTADVGALDALALEVTLDHHLRRDAGMVGANHPQSVLAEHPLAPGEDVLERDVERVAD